MTKLVSLANPESSYIAMNVLYYDEETQSKVMKKFNDHVKTNVDSLYFAEIEGWTNKVFMFAKDQTKANIMEYADN